MSGGDVKLTPAAAAQPITVAPGAAANNSRDYVMHLKKYTGPNPFVSRTPAGVYETIKIIFMSLTMIPLVRLILIGVCILLQYLFACLVTCCVCTGAAGGKRQPMTGIRTIWVYPIRLLFRIILLIAGFWWISVKDNRPRNAPRKAHLLVANHISMWDMFPLIYRDGVGGAGKAELFSLPLLGRILQAMQCVPVGRETGEGRKQALDAIVERAQNKSGLWPPLVIFPQGTTTNDRVVSMFKKGAFAPRQPVQPVLLRYNNSNFDLYLDASALACLWRSLCQFVNFCSIEYLEEYHPSPAEIADDQLYATNVRSLMANQLGAITTEHDFNDLRLAVDAARAHLKVDFVLNDVAENFHSRYDDVKLLMKVFRQFDTHRQGAIKLEDFAAAIGLRRDHDTARRLFALFDTDANGRIEFGEFVVAMSIASKNCTPLDSAKILFEVCDLDGDRKVTRDELTRVLALARGVHAPLADITAKHEAAAAGGQSPHGGGHGHGSDSKHAGPADIKIDMSGGGANGPASSAGAGGAAFDIRDADVFTVLFPPGSNSDTIEFDEFVRRLTSPGAEQTARNLINLFLWKRMAPLDANPHPNTQSGSGTSGGSPPGLASPLLSAGSATPPPHGVDPMSPQSLPSTAPSTPPAGAAVAPVPHS